MLGVRYQMISVRLLSCLFSIPQSLVGKSCFCQSVMDTLPLKLLLSSLTILITVIGQAWGLGPWLS